MTRPTGIDEESLANLDPQAVMRLEHAGEWVAWTEGFERIVASGNSREEVRAAAVAAGVVHPICEWLPASLTRHFGPVE